MEQLSGRRSNTTLWQSASNTSELRCFDCSGRGTSNDQRDGERCTSSLHDVDRTNVEQCLIFLTWDAAVGEETIKLSPAMTRPEMAPSALHIHIAAALGTRNVVS